MKNFVMTGDAPHEELRMHLMMKTGDAPHDEVVMHLMMSWRVATSHPPPLVLMLQGALSYFAGESHDALSLVRRADALRKELTLTADDDEKVAAIVALGRASGVPWNPHPLPAGSPWQQHPIRTPCVSRPR